MRGTELPLNQTQKFRLQSRVFPSSFSIKASLGNLRITDDSLPENHMYFWACDMRNPGGSSFVEFASLEKVKEVEEFFATRSKPAIARTLKQSIERVKINAKWVESIHAEKNLADAVTEFL
ncbi:hypothetical protein F8388_020388 [Cannabis sativa]|uniref:Uncharacterized protein n=1 Tax=Cannabis sativa TaxID=3483 RepID=A0A7J6HGZ0_CANSA|nr:hypothetical protein G4B88_005637 [Cannabis sativa]KAF4394563.1 hypothetical protein F8388_020388 [Cannabis sativa]